jgi:hypothetical protein
MVSVWRRNASAFGRVCRTGRGGPCLGGGVLRRAASCPGEHPDGRVERRPPPGPAKRVQHSTHSPFVPTPPRPAPPPPRPRPPPARRHRRPLGRSDAAAAQCKRPRPRRVRPRRRRRGRARAAPAGSARRALRRHRRRAARRGRHGAAAGRRPGRRAPRGRGPRRRGLHLLPAQWRWVGWGLELAARGRRAATPEKRRGRAGEPARGPAKAPPRCAPRNAVSEALFKGNVLGVDADVARGDFRHTQLRALAVRRGRGRGRRGRRWDGRARPGAWKGRGRLPLGVSEAGDFEAGSPRRGRSRPWRARLLPPAAPPPAAPRPQPQHLPEGLEPPPALLRRVAVHYARNLLAGAGAIPGQVPLVLGIWGPKVCWGGGGVAAACPRRRQGRGRAGASRLRLLLSLPQRRTAARPAPR